jgi:hypothetical protein
VWGRIAASAGPPKGPFLQVEGLFTLRMCPTCQAARSSSNHDLPTTQAETPVRDPGQPPELLAHHDPGQPWYRWGCPLPGCDHWVILPWDLETHAVANHPGWVARYELVRPLPHQHQRVVFRQLEQPPAS